jgi:hypothetical protein
MVLPFFYQQFLMIKNKIQTQLQVKDSVTSQERRMILLSDK